MGCKHSTPVSQPLASQKIDQDQDKSGAIRDIVGGDPDTKKYPLVGPNSIMRQKGNGTYTQPVQSDLRYGCDVATADRICNHNRHAAEHAGYFAYSPRSFLKATAKAKRAKKPITFYDSNTGLPLFTAPRGRTWDEFIKESKAHGWPSFRDLEVNWENVRCLKNGESVSIHGTHLGHNLPDRNGNRYCINLVSVAGNPAEGIKEENGLVMYT